MSSLLWDLPLIGNLLRIQSRIERYSPEKQRQFIKDLKDKVGLGENVTFNEKAFDKYVELRRHDFSGFFKKPKEPETLTEEQTNLAKKLGAEGKDPTAVRDAITKAIELTDDTKKAQEKYADSVAAFKTLLSDVPEKHSVRAVIGTLTQYRNQAVEAIEKQQKTEVDNLTKALADPATKESLRVSLDIGPIVETTGTTAEQAAANAAKLKSATDSIIADLQNGHKKQLQYFTDNTNKSINELHVQAQSKAAEIGFIHYLSTLNNVTAEKIEAMRQKRQSKGVPGLEVEAGADVHMVEDRIYLSGITLKEIGDITTESGKVLKYDPQTDSYTMDMTRHIFSPKYYTDPRNNPLADATMIAHAIKAGGYTTINMNVTYKEQYIADERGREAFEACINAGFPPEDITVVVNGKTYSTNPKDGATAMSELFKEGHNRQYSALSGKSKKVIEGMESNAALISESTKDAKPDSKLATEIETNVTATRTKRESLAAEKAAAAARAATATTDPSPPLPTI